jgi:hypothetical protein
MRAAVTMAMATMSVWSSVAVAAPSPTAGAEKPAAVQVCFSGLEAKTPLFAEKAQKNYRPIGDMFVLDLDLTVDGKAPERLTRSGNSCLRAWVPVHNVRTIDVNFDRTDTNLLKKSMNVNLKLKPDLWYNGGEVKVTRGARANFKTSLPGKVALARLSTADGKPVEIDVPQADWNELAAGRYVIRHTPPPPSVGSCPFKLVVEAGGTVREDNRPDQVHALVEHYRTDIAPDVIGSLKQSCSPAEVIEIHVAIWDGLFVNPRDPKIVRSARPDMAPIYTLTSSGKAQTYNPGDPFSVGYGDSLSLDWKVPAPHPPASVANNNANP